MVLLAGRGCSYYRDSLKVGVYCKRENLGKNILPFALLYYLAHVFPLQEWELYNFVEIDPLDISAQYTRARINYPGVTATSCVARRAGFFAWNVLVIVVSIS